MFYYVGVQVPEGLALVTSVNPMDQSIDFKPFKRPIQFTEKLAFSVCGALIDRLYRAVVVVSERELTDQYFLVAFR